MPTVLSSRVVTLFTALPMRSLLQITSHQQMQLLGGVDDILDWQTGDIAWYGRNLLLLQNVILFEAEHSSGLFFWGQKWTETFEPAAEIDSHFVVKTHKDHYYLITFKDVDLSRIILSFKPIDESLVAATEKASS